MITATPATSPIDQFKTSLQAIQEVVALRGTEGAAAKGIEIFGSDPILSRIPLAAHNNNPDRRFPPLEQFSSLPHCVHFVQTEDANLTPLYICALWVLLGRNIPIQEDRPEQSDASFFLKLYNQNNITLVGEAPVFPKGHFLKRCAVINRFEGTVEVISCACLLGTRDTPPKWNISSKHYRYEARNDSLVATVKLDSFSAETNYDTLVEFVTCIQNVDEVSAVYLKAITEATHLIREIISITAEFLNISSSRALRSLPPLSTTEDTMGVAQR